MNPPNEPDDRPAQSPPGSLSPGVKVGQGRFTLKKILGQGGMGMVWLAQDEHLQELVALKFLPPQIQFDEVALAQLRRETIRSRKLSHPNIIRIHDLHQHHGEDPFIAMEYVDGPTLHSLRFSLPTQTITWSQLAPLTKQLCDALDYAHGEKIIHRDLKPSNLMLDSNGRLKLADFGIATAINDSWSRLSVGPGSGTPPYMSPQQINGERPQATDDIYSLGATLYELLTGTPPFFTGQIVHQVLNNPPAPVCQRLRELELQNEIPASVESLIMACLAKAPNQRPQSGRAVAERLGCELAPRSQASAPTVTLRESALHPETPPPSARKKFWAYVSILLVLLAIIAGWQLTKTVVSKSSQGAAMLPAAITPDGFKTLFNGTDLTGWEGDTNVWSVRDGVLVGTVKVGDTNYVNSALQWHEAALENFELHFWWRGPRAQAMGSLLFRRLPSAPLRNSFEDPDWILLYTYWKNDGKPDVCLATGGRRIRLGEKVVVARDGTENRAWEWLKNYQDFGEIGEMEGWNESTLIVQGPYVAHILNGHKILEVTDAQWQSHPHGDRLALMVNAAWVNAQPGDLCHFDFRDLRLKRLTVNPETNAPAIQK